MSDRPQRAQQSASYRSSLLLSGFCANDTPLEPGWPPRLLAAPRTVSVPPPSPPTAHSAFSAAFSASFLLCLFRLLAVTVPLSELL